VEPHDGDLGRAGEGAGGCQCRCSHLT
jgi:hypothetical protein